LYDSSVDVITDGKTHKVAANDQYLKTSITDPDKDIVVGYNKGLMKSYSTLLKPDEIQKIIDYLKTMKSK